MLFASERFCSAKSANLLLFHHRVNRYLLGDGIGPDRAVDVRQSLFYNSGKVLRLGVDVRQAGGQTDGLAEGHQAWRGCLPPEAGLSIA